MKVAAVQMDVRFGEKERNIQKALEHMGNVKSDLYVLPELFNTGYLFTSQSEVEQLAEPIPDGTTTQALAEFTITNNCYGVAGLAENCGGEFFNSAVLVGPKGFINTYRKIHLFNNEKQWFATGDKPFMIVDIGTAKIGMMICFDWIFPESMRSLALLGADVICHPANLVLPYCPDAIITRCLENRLFAVTANRIGLEKRGGRSLSFIGTSQITGHGGDVLARASRESEEVIIAEIDPLLARDKHVTPKNDLFADRQLELYTLSKGEPFTT